jgi:DNA polymerase-1
MPQLLSEQWPFLEELSEAFGFTNVALPGFEADDILATLASQAEDAARDLVIVTGDRDALQLVGDRVTVMATARGITDVKLYDPMAVEERFGIPPRLIPDMIGLKGDTSDNIPGVPGIGEKTAAQLLVQFGSLEAVLAHTDEVKGAKRQALLREHADTARLSKRLAVLDREAPIDLQSAELAPHRVDLSRLEELFQRFEFSSLLDRVHESLSAQRESDAADDVQPRQAVSVMSKALPELDDVIDWERPVAVGVRESDAGLRVWLAQMPPPPAQTGGSRASTPVSLPPVFEVVDAPVAAGPLGELMRRGRPVCHDYKGTPLLHGLFPQAGHDTLLAGYLLLPGRRAYDLWDLAADVRIEAAPREGPEAGAAEAATAAALAAAQESALRRLGMWDLFQDIELPLTRVLMDMEAAGVHLDCYQLGEIAAKIQDQVEGLEIHIHELAGEPFNLGSPQQLGQVLFERLGLPRQRKTKTGYSTDAKTLGALRASHPIVELIEQHRELSKLLSTYLFALPEAVDAATGRLHTTFHQTVAATGRLSSSDPNLQNIPVRTQLGAQIRECFTAEDGHLLVVADYSQIELRIMAYLSQESTLLEAFHNGEDIHTRTAAEVFDLEESTVDSTRRRYAKAVNFGIMYGISAFGLAQQLGIEREEAAAYIERYFERMPRVRAFIDATISDASSQGFVATIFGRRRPIPELRSSNFQTRSLGERLAVNSVIQGSAADIIKVAMIRCHGRLQRGQSRARQVLQVHDELLFEAPADEARDVARAMVEEMVGAFPMDPPLVVDAGVGPNWLAAK